MLDVQSQEVSSLAMQPGTIPGQAVWAADSSSVITVGIVYNIYISTLHIYNIYTYLQYLRCISTLYIYNIYTYLHCISTHIYITTPCRWRVLTPGPRAPRALTRPRGWCG